MVNVGASDRLRAALDAALPAAPQRREVLNVRLSAAELEALRKEAKRRKVPAATLARAIIGEALALLGNK